MTDKKDLQIDYYPILLYINLFKIKQKLRGNLGKIHINILRQCKKMGKGIK